MAKSRPSVPYGANFLLWTFFIVLRLYFVLFFVCENRRSPKHLEAITCSSSSKSAVMRVYDRMRDTLFCQRSICIVSCVPLMATFERILRSLHETALSSQPSAVVDSISNLLNDISMPTPGTSLRLTVPNGTIVCQRPGKHRLPVFYLGLRYSLLFPLILITERFRLAKSLLLCMVCFINLCNYKMADSHY